jgi:hypothetical protein
MSDIPRELDWVSERAKCDIKSAFELLRQAVEKDVERYKALPGFRGQIEFSSDPDWLFSVSRRSNITMVAVFNRVNDHIEITFPAQTQPPLKAVPVLTETGCWKFRIDGQEGEPLFDWQLRRCVLEPLLFPNQGA